MTLKIRVITSYGGWFDMDQPEKFDLCTYVQAIRAAGYALNKSLYVPHEHIVTIFTFDSEAMPEQPVPGSQPLGPTGTLQ
jgi:hypothetical protein